MSRVLNVFYGADRLPYKDQERQVHYPMVGNSFAGASLVDEIRFYAKDLGTENNVFVGIAKRPDGQRGYQVLTYGYDTELNEPYWTFNVAGWFTEKVGNVFVSLNVYQGGVDIEVDEDSGLAIVSGTPIIQATGSVVLSINYAPVMDNGYGAVPTIDVQEALSLVSSKVDTDYLTANYYNKTDVDGKLLLKADLSYVNGFVKTLEVSMDSSTYVLTFTCKDGTGTTISTQSIDLPLESVVVSGEYDSATQSIILTLQNGNTITIPVSDLVDGLVDTTTFESAIQGIEDALDLKANANEVYTKDEVDTLLNAKADKTITTSLQNQINDLNSRLTVVEEAIIGVDTLTFTALSYSAIPNVSDNLYPIIQSGGLDTKEVKGNSFVHTQLCQNNTDSQTINTVTFTNNSDGSWTVNGTATADITKSVCSVFQVVAGHYYLLCGCASGGSNSTYRLLEGYSYRWSDTGNGYIQVANSSGNAGLIFEIKNGTTCNNLVFKPQFFDLTKDFGAGNEPTTYDQAVSMYASKGIDITNYVQYTQGTLIDSKPVKLISRGYNLLVSQPIYSSSVVPFNSQTFTKLMANKPYTLEFENLVNATSYRWCLSFYNENGEIINDIDLFTFSTAHYFNQSGLCLSSNNISASAKTLSITPKVNCYIYVNIGLGDVSATTVMSNVSLHLTGSRTGYAPYKAPIEYPITTEVLRSAGSVQDSAVSKKVGSVDLGTLDWAYGSDYNNFYVLVPSLVSGVYGQKPNIICSKYSTANSDYRSGQAINSLDKVITVWSTFKYLIVKDSSYTDANTFKSAMSGVILNYELATPAEQTATLPTDIEIEKGGSLEVVYDNGYTTPADFVFDCAVYKPLE